jgi:hypothetical protein
MTANVTVPPSNGGFASRLPGDRVMRGIIARWSATTGWGDRDGLPLPDTMLVMGFTTVLRRWKDKKPEYITEHPLPDPKQLNAAIPVAEWEIGLDGKPCEPWKLTCVIYMVDVFKTGALYTYAHDTWGAMQAYNNLEEQIVIMRMLRGEHVFPIVHLEKRPWKSQKYGMQTRPHLQPTGDWRSPGGSQSVPQSPTPQLSGPPTPTPPASTPTTPTTLSSTSTPPPPPATAATPAAPASMVLDNTKPVKPVTVAELVADEIPWK